MGEMKDYYERDDILSFLYDECCMRNIDIAFRRERWPINPISKANLKDIIEETIKNKIERAYRNSAYPVDDVRLEKFDYLSFHFRTSIVYREKLAGFDTIFEADLQGWRRAFEDLCGVIQLLDNFGVCYRIKYSGVRSLHFMIPFESLPEQFNGKSILSQRVEIQTKIQEYFRWCCGMEKAHGGGVMRLAYSLNEDNGLVSLPISPDELPLFRPWEANIHNVVINKPWHGDVPASAKKNTLKFLKEVYGYSARDKRKKPVKANPDLEITPKDRSRHIVGHKESSLEEWGALLKSSEELVRVKAAWDLMTTPEAVPVSILEMGLNDKNPDVRWYLTEALQKRLDDDAVKLAGKLLWDDDQFVRISAIDALALSGEDALQALLNSMFSGSGDLWSSLNDAIYAIRKIRPEGEAGAMRSFLESIGSSFTISLQNSIERGTPLWIMSRYIKQLRDLCRFYSIEESLIFRNAIEMLVPQTLKFLGEGRSEYFYLWILLEIRRNEAIPRIIMREIASSLGIDPAKIPSNRMDKEEKEFLARIIHVSLSGMTKDQKVRILYSFWRRYKKSISEPAGNLLKHIQQSDSLIAESIIGWMDDDSAVAISVGANVELFQDKSVEELIQMLGDGWRIRTAAARALAQKCKTDEDIDKVIAVLNRIGTRRRIGAVAALGEMVHHPKAQKAVVEALSSQRWDVRRAALKVYIGLNPPDAVDILLRALEEWRSATALHGVVSELWRYMKDERVINKLREIVAKEQFPFRARMKAERLLRRIPGR